MKKFTKFFVCVISVVVTVMALGISACSKDVLATQVSLDKTELIMVKGNLEQLKANVDEKATNKNVEWKSSDETKFTVSETGLVTAVDEGEATITVTTKDGSNLTDTCKVYSVKSFEEKYFKNGFSEVKEIENNIDNMIEIAQNGIMNKLKEMQDGIITTEEYERTTQKLMREIDGLTLQSAELLTEQSKVQLAEYRVDAVKNLLNNGEILEEFDKAIFKSLVKRMKVIGNGEIEIEFECGLKVTETL